MINLNDQTKSHPDCGCHLSAPFAEHHIQKYDYADFDVEIQPKANMVLPVEAQLSYLGAVSGPESVSLASASNTLTLSLDNALGDVGSVRVCIPGCGYWDICVAIRDDGSSTGVDAPDTVVCHTC